MKVSQITYIVRFGLMIVAAGILLTGCRTSNSPVVWKTYSGPALPVGQDAVLILELGDNVGVSAVDRNLRVWGAMGHGIVRLLPGFHSIVFNYVQYEGSWTEKGTITKEMVFKAGKTYRATYERQGMLWSADINEEQ